MEALIKKTLSQHFGSLFKTLTLSWSFYDKRWTQIKTGRGNRIKTVISVVILLQWNPALKPELEIMMSSTLFGKSDYNRVGSHDSANYSLTQRQWIQQQTQPSLKKNKPQTLALPLRLYYICIYVCVNVLLKCKWLDVFGDSQKQ